MTSPTADERVAETITPAAAVVNAWEAAEGETMRDGFRQTLENLITQAIREAEVRTAEKFIDFGKAVRDEAVEGKRG